MAEQFNLVAFEVIHSEKALPHGIRIEIEDKVIAYSGDTSWTDALLPLSASADLFICECNFFSTKVKRAYELPGGGETLAGVFL